MSHTQSSLISDVLTDRSTSARLVNALRDEIIHGRLKSGERLRQDAIASQFGVSQTVAREAFRDLVRECFLIAEPRRGVRVATMSIDEVEEITRLRSLIEPQALAWAIPRMSATHIETARKLLEELDNAENVEQLILLNAQFHRVLYVSSGRERTLAMVETLRLSFERYLRYTWESTVHLHRSQKEHWELLSLCEHGDVESACIFLRDHISATGRLLANRLEDVQNKLPS